MEKDKFVKGPNTVHPEKPSARGSRNSLNRDGRNEYQEAKLVIDEEIDKVLNHISGKLPPEVLNKMDVMGGIKEKLHNYYNQNLQNMQNRYIVTVEDELLKKYHDVIDKEEYKQLNRYTPIDIAEIMDKLGGSDQFNTAGIEKSIVNIYEHLQGHLKRGVQEYEHNTNALLRQKNDVGAFIRRENAYAIIKCSVKNNVDKPKTVFDVKLAINILDSELLLPIYHYQKPLQELLKEIISDHIHNLIDVKLDDVNTERLNRGEEEIKKEDRFMEKLKSLENYLAFGDDPADEKSKRYDYIAKRLMDSLASDDMEPVEDSQAAQAIRESIKGVIDRENIKNLGFNKIVNALTTILDNSKMGYQHIENLKNARVCVIREYALTDKEDLPDENFILRLSYFDNEQLIEMKKAYDVQLEELSREIEKASEVVSKFFEDYRDENDIRSYQDVAREILEGEVKSNKKWWEFWKEEEFIESEDVLWNELSFVTTRLDEEDSGVARTNQNQAFVLKKRFSLMRKQIQQMFGTQFPEERIILEERITFLENEYQKFAAMINPHHVQQGLVLEVDIRSVKRRRTTMHAMSDVLNEFLTQVSRGFTDQRSEGGQAADFSGHEAISQKFSSVLKDMDKSLEEVEA